jgi:hypothetical protein
MIKEDAIEICINAAPKRPQNTYAIYRIGSQWMFTTHTEIQTQSNYRVPVRDFHIIHKGDGSPRRRAFLIIFIGEKPSKTAFEKGWTWESKRLASATLHEALATIGFDTALIKFMNLFGDHPDNAEVATKLAIRKVTIHHLTGNRLVAMGQKVSRELSALGIEHATIVHPAARGKIRAKHLYAAHVREILG